MASKQNELKTFIDYCKNNSDYLRNECIIEGIRNSISHGNYRVKAESSLEECKIIFEDIYEGRLTFKAQIKLLDFITLLVNNHNIISNFVDNKSKKISLKWKKISGAKGYQIQYATNKKFKSKKTKTTTKLRYTIKKLKKKKTYYVRVRAYKSSKKKVYGKWSNVKKIKVKK